MIAFRSALARWLIDDARRRWHRLWSIRIALFWGGVSGLYMALPAFQNVLPPRVFAGLCILAGGAIAGARLTKQPGAE